MPAHPDRHSEPQAERFNFPFEPIHTIKI